MLLNESHSIMTVGHLCYSLASSSQIVFGDSVEKHTEKSTEMLQQPKYSNGAAVRLGLSKAHKLNKNSMDLGIFQLLYNC